MSDTLTFLHNSTSGPTQFACRDMCHKYKIFHNLDETGHEQTPSLEDFTTVECLQTRNYAADRSPQATERPQVNFINLRSPFGLIFLY